MARKILFLLLQFILFINVNIIYGLQCPRDPVTGNSNCAVPSELNFCQPYVTYSTCIYENVEVQQEAAAIESVENIKARYGNLSSQCLDTLSHFECAKVFPACDLEGNVEFLCQTACEQLKQACNQSIPESGYVTICYFDDVVYEDESEACFNLDYTGYYYLWAIGLALALGFSFLNSVAINVQKLSINRHDGDTMVLKQPLWILGFFLLLVGSVMDFVALGLAPASLLAPLAALSLVWNMLTAPCFLKERLDLYQILSTLVIFTGAVITVVFSNHTSPVYTLDDLKTLFLRTAMVAYSIILPLLAAAHVVVIQVVETVPVELRSSTLRRLHMVGFAGTAGLVGGQSIIFAKMTMELLKAAYGGAKGLESSVEMYLIISALLLCLLVQITFLNGALALYDSLSVVPIYQAYWIVSGVVGGLVYFDEIKTFAPLQLGIFCLGILVTMTGVVLLSRRHGHSKKAFGRGRVTTGEEDDDENVFEDDTFEDETNMEKHNILSSYAFDDVVNMTPRHSTAALLVSMGVRPNRVEKILGRTKVNPGRERQELMLADMGVSPQMASRILERNSASSVDSLLLDNPNTPKHGAHSGPSTPHTSGRFFSSSPPTGSKRASSLTTTPHITRKSPGQDMRVSESSASTRKESEEVEPLKGVEPEP